jgi:glycosyltransferase involved in cell wall biosynthesis
MACATMCGMRSERGEPGEFGINLFGYLTGNLGLGVAARNTAQMLLACGVPIRLVDVNPGGGMQGHDTSLAEAIRETAEHGPYPVNLFHINPDQMVYLLDPLSGVVALGDTLNVCVPFWELPIVPASWVEPLHAMDAVFAPTRFVEESVRRAVPDARIERYPQTAHVPGDVEPNRAEFGLPEHATIFVTSFDLRSDIERKNPWAAIEAFHRAFPERDDVRLVIKTNNVETIAGLERHVASLREVAHDERVIVLDRPLTYRSVLTLYASCDVLLSLHRAEGLGLSLLEAMALGKPVVATAWSGNMDFMTAENSCLVGFDMIEVVASTQPAYGKGTSGTQEWANPRVAEAAEWMWRLAAEPQLRERIGARAAADVAALTKRYDGGEPLLGEVRALLDAVRRDPRVHAEPARRMASLRRRYYWLQAARIARAVRHRIATRVG